MEIDIQTFFPTINAAVGEIEEQGPFDGESKETV